MCEAHIDFFSSPYLDVSVREVPADTVNIPINRDFGRMATEDELSRVSPFGHRRIIRSWLFPDAYRSHARPSSVV